MSESDALDHDALDHEALEQEWARAAHEEDATLNEIVADLAGRPNRDVLRALVIVARRQAETNQRLATIGAVLDERIPGDLGG